MTPGRRCGRIPSPLGTGVCQSHLSTYLLVNAGLITLNLLTSPRYLWFFFPLIFWGFGLVSHAARTFNWNPLFGRRWEERQTRAYMEKMRREERQSEGRP